MRSVILYNSKKNLEFLLGKSNSKELSRSDKEGLEALEKYKEKFISAMEDDLNTADAIASLFELVKHTNTSFDENTNYGLIERAYNILLELTKVLGILRKEDEILEDEILELIENRTQARINKDYKLSDEIRDLLKDKGIVLEDSPEGVKWKRI